MSRMWSTCSMSTGHCSTQAPQVVQLHSTSGSTTPPASAVPTRGTPPPPGLGRRRRGGAAPPARVGSPDQRPHGLVVVGTHDALVARLGDVPAVAAVGAG